MKDIFTGRLVRLSAVDTGEFGRAFANWNRDSEFKRLLQTNAASIPSSKTIKGWLEKEVEESPTDFYPFSIRTLDDDTLVGGTDIEVINWSARDSFVAIFIGDRSNWGKGYGTDAMNILVRYAFDELNLRRVSLSVFEYNHRAVKSYEKVGFRHEGQMRKLLNKESQRWDMLLMSIQRDEWMEKYGNNI